ncbi:hypothetical protein HMPREF3039_00432 [Akkermansia sp. KLE1798]|nr:hypothetical protein HMPREF3039_00432 [Akkermansia sp. KLE1798]
MTSSFLFLLLLSDISQDPLHGSPTTFYDAQAVTSGPKKHSQQEKYKHYVT